MGNSFVKQPQEAASGIRQAATNFVQSEGEIYVRHRMKQIAMAAIDESSWGTVMVVVPLAAAVLLFVVAMFFILGMLCYENVKTMFWRTLWSLLGALGVFLIGYGVIFSYVWLYELA